MRSPVNEPPPPGLASDSVPRLKDELRRKAVTGREGAAPDVRAAWSRAVRERVLRLEAWRGARVVALFAAIRGEVDVLPLVAEALLRGKRAVFPRANRADRTLTFHGVASASDLVPGAFGVPEPPADPSRRVGIDEIDLLFVPGVAFDARGRRLGFGGGFYDRLIASRPGRARPGDTPRPLAVGLAFECQLLAEVPAEPSDERVDVLVTEVRTAWCDEHMNASTIL